MIIDQLGTKYTKSFNFFGGWDIHRRKSLLKTRRWEWNTKKGQENISKKQADQKTNKSNTQQIPLAMENQQRLTSGKLTYPL